jgi:hypothetical protein
MSLFNDASLVMIPSGYKNGKVYSVKPTDGAGDLTFTRASDATRVASNGLIEKVRTNLLTYSNTFSDAAWTTGVGTKPTTTQNVTDPFGVANNAWTITGAGTTFSRLIRLSITLTTAPQTLSFFVKKGTATTVTIFTAQTSVADFTFNFDTQAITGSDGGYNVIRKATALSDGWFRLSMTLSTTSGTSSESWGFSLDGSITTTFLLFGGMLENGDVATDYIPTTTTAVSVGPVSGLPRLDYYDSTCPRLLLEPQRTNGHTFSENFDNAAWNKLNATISANAAVSPSGYQDADKLIDNSTSGGHIAFQTYSFASAAAHTISIFAKAAEITSINIYNNVAAGFDATFNLSNGTVTSVASGGTATITSYGNGWYRCAVTATASVSSLNTQFRLVKSGSTSYVGNGTDGAFIWGAQVELGAYATSYIPTLGTSVTRVADAASKTGISSLIGQTEGVIFFDYVASAQNQDGAGFAALTIFGTASDNIQLYNIGTTLYWYARNTAGVLIDQTANQTLVAGQRYKIAYAYKSGDYALYINGVQKRTYTGSAVPAVSQFNLCGTGFGVTPAGVKNEFSQMLLFKTRLTNAQLAELTA